MADPQITIRLDPATKAAFEAYARHLGLKASELAKLLLVRERSSGRLAKLLRAGETPSRPRRVRAGINRRLPTVTAHLSSKKDVEVFDAYADRCGLSRSSAGAWLLESELRERWLDRALRMK